MRTEIFWMACNDIVPLLLLDALFIPSSNDKRPPITKDNHDTIGESRFKDLQNYYYAITGNQPYELAHLQE